MYIYICPVFFCALIYLCMHPLHACTVYSVTVLLFVLAFKLPRNLDNLWCTVLN